MNPNAIKKAALTVALLVLTALFIGLLVDAIFDYPSYEEYCNYRDYEYARPMMPLQKEPVNCTEIPQETLDKCYEAKGNPIYDYDAYGCPKFRKCDTCNAELEDARKVVNEKAFYLGIFLSLVVIILGMFWPIEFIGTGFMFGGVVGLFYSTVRYFADMNKMFRVAVIFFEMCVIIGIAYLKLVNKEGAEKIRKARFRVRRN